MDIFAGQDTVSKPDKIQERIAAAAATVRQSQLQTLFLVVGIGAQSDTKIGALSCSSAASNNRMMVSGMVAKRALQTVQSSRDSSVYYARQPSDIPDVIATVCPA